MRTLAVVSFVLMGSALAQDQVLGGLPDTAEAVAYERPYLGDGFVAQTLPREELPLGVAYANGEMFVLYGDELLVRARSSGKPDRRLPLAVQAYGLAADDRSLYALGRAHGKDSVCVLDPATGGLVRTLEVSGLDGPALGVAVHAGSLWVITPQRLHAVDRDSGVATARGELRVRQPMWLASDDQGLVIGSPLGAWRVSANGGESQVALLWVGGNVDRSIAAWLGDTWFVAVEDRTRVFEPALTAGTVAQLGGLDVLSLRLYRDEGGGVKFEVGPFPARDREHAAADLTRLAKSGGVRAVHVVAHRGVLIRDLRDAVAMARAAGFADVRCPRQEAWLVWNEADAKARWQEVASKPLRLQLQRLRLEPGRPLVVGADGDVVGLASDIDHYIVARGERLLGYALSDGDDYDVALPAGTESMAAFGPGVFTWQAKGTLTLLHRASSKSGARALPDLAGSGKLATVGTRVVLVRGRSVHLIGPSGVRNVTGELPFEPRFVCGDERWLWVGDARMVLAFVLTDGEQPSLTPAPVGPRSWPSDVEVLAGCWDRDRLLVAHRCEANGAPAVGLTHVEGSWDPRPEGSIRVTISRNGSVVRYELDGQEVAPADLATAFGKRASEASSLVTWPRGERRQLPVAMVPGTGAKFDDIVAVTAAARAAGFLDIDVAPRENAGK